MKRLAFAFLLALIPLSQSLASESIRLANNPALSPDGQWLAFDWNGDIWLAPSIGGEAKPRTAYPGRDTHPKFSPDGTELAFVSDREGGNHIFTLSIDGGLPKQLTFHTGGSLIQEYSADGKTVLVKATRDNFWRHGERFFSIKSNARSAELPLFHYWRDAPGGGDRLAFGRVLRVGSTSAIRALVLAGEGVATLPVHIVGADLARGRLVRIFPKDALLSDYFRLIFRADDPRRAIHEDLARLLLEVPLPGR